MAFAAGGDQVEERKETDWGCGGLGMEDVVEVAKRLWPEVWLWLAFWRRCLRPYYLSRLPITATSRQMKVSVTLP